MTMEVYYKMINTGAGKKTERDLKRSSSGAYPGTGPGKSAGQETGTERKPSLTQQPVSGSHRIKNVQANKEKTSILLRRGGRMMLHKKYRIRDAAALFCLSAALTACGAAD